MTGVERDDVERVAIVWMRCRGESELRGQAFGDLRPRLARVVAAVHADVVLLVHAAVIDGRAHELVHAEADLFVLSRPVGAEATIPRRPRLRVVRRLEQPHALHDRPEPVGVITVEHQRRDAEMPGRLIRRIVPLVAPGLSGERRQQRPCLAFVAALEDSGRFDADEQTTVADGERRDFRDLSAAIGVVGDPFARVRPGFAEVGASPDSLTMPFARGRGVHGAALGVLDDLVHRPAFAEGAA